MAVFACLKSPGTETAGKMPGRLIAIHGARSCLRLLFFSGSGHVVVCGLDPSGAGEDLEQAARVLVRGVEQHQGRALGLPVAVFPMAQSVDNKVQTYQLLTGPVSMWMKSDLG